MIRGNHTGSAFFRDSIPGAATASALGFRWEPVVPHSDPPGRISYLDITAANPGAGNRLGAMRFGGSPDNGNRFLNNLWSNFAPRIGVAYRITERSVVRFGGGIYINSNYINHGLGSPVFGYSTTAAFTSPDGNRTAASFGTAASRRTSAVRQ